MTTRDPDPKANGKGTARRVRPDMERTSPQRSIVNAFRQPDDADRTGFSGRSFEDDEVWSAHGRDDRAQSSEADGDATSADSGRDGKLWSDPLEAVRSAYSVVNEQILAGYQEAGRQSTGDGAPIEKRLTKIVNRLVQTYSDLGTQWVDLVLATAEGRDVKSEAQTAQTPQPSAEMSVAVELKTGRLAKARALLYRPVHAGLSVWPLRKDGGGAEISEVTIAPGPTVTIEIDESALPGLYRGILIEDGVEEPAGSVIVTVVGADDD